jgi:branched-chain amino acid transport system permease protein
MLVVLPLTAAIVAALAALVGLVLVRQVGKTFAILTLAMGQIMFAAVFVFSGVTGGEDGLQGVPVPTLLGMSVNNHMAWYWTLYVALIASIAGAIFLRHSPLGRSWLAIKENTERARFIGLNVNRLKLMAYVISAALAAVAGGLHVLFNGAAAPDLLHWFESGKILMYAVLGGLGTIVGPVIGAIVFTLIEHYVSSYTQSWMIFFGAIFVFIVIVAPGGLYGLFSRVLERSSASRGK